MKKAIQRCSFVVLAVFICFAFISRGYGAINSWGDVQPPNPSTWTSDTTAYIGKDANGGISVTEGDDIVAHDAYLGYNAGISGSVTIDGVGSSWSCYRGSLYVGNSGQGTLAISNGGYVSCWYGYIGNESGSMGGVFVVGESSSWYCDYRLSVGCYGEGTLQISHGGSVSCEGALSVGSYGQGTLNISNAGSCNSWEGYIGKSSGSTGEVSIDGEGSSWNCNYNLYVGFYGQGTLAISNGGNVSCGWGHIGKHSGSIGEVSVDGEGSRMNCSNVLYIGYEGQGTLEISNGGNVEVGETLQVGSNGTLNIDSTSKASIGGFLIFKQDSTLTTQEGAKIHMTGADFQNESTNSANLAGLSNLTLIFEGGSEVVDDLEVAGKDEGAVSSAFSVDNFLIGTLQLGGEAAGRIKLVDDFDNQPGWSGSEALYVSNLIMNAGATIDLNDLNLYYLNGGSPKQFFNGDANLDGSVDVSDLGILAGNYGGTGKSWSEGDFDGDLVVDISDLGILAGNYGSSTGGAVPEPATLMLLGLGGLGLLIRKKR